MDSSWKNSWHTFFSCPSYPPFWSYALWKKQWNLMHAMSYEPCMLGFWKFIWIPHGKIADHYFFSCPSSLPFWSYASLKRSEWNLVSKITLKVFELGLETWSADRGWRLDYLIKFFIKSPYFSSVMALWKFGHFEKIIMKSFQQDVSQKVFELGLETW